MNCRKSYNESNKGQEEKGQEGIKRFTITKEMKTRKKIIAIKDTILADLLNVISCFQAGNTYQKCA